MEQSPRIPGTITMPCDEAAMKIKIENENETENCCLSEQIKYVHDELSSLEQQQEEQSAEKQYSCIMEMERKRKHRMDDTTRPIPKRNNKTCETNNGFYKWERKFQLLCKFYKREGHCNVPKRHVEDGIKLGIWLSHQKQFKKKGSLDRKRVTQLNELGIFWDVATEQWEGRYQLLRKFSKREGHCNVPVSHVEYGINLGTWLYTQRKLKKKGSLDRKTVNRLNELGICWDVATEQWERSFQLLRKFSEREGHCYVPRSHVEDGINLGVWLHAQRKLKKKGSLDRKRVIRLNELGICWDVLTEQWERKYELLRKFIDREGHCNVPLRHEEDGIKLGSWLCDQRKINKKGRMDPDRMRLMIELGAL